MDKDNREYLKRYRKERLKRIALDVKKDYYEKIKLAAEIDGVNVSRYIKGLIEDDLKRKEWPIAKKMADAKNNANRVLTDYCEAEQQEKMEKVVFNQYDVTGKYIGKAVAFLTPENAEKYRAAQKERFK